MWSFFTQILKEFIRVDVEVYIVSCDGNYTVILSFIWHFSGPFSIINHLWIVFVVYILEKLHSCMFFDDEIKTSMFFPTLHDAMVHILQIHPDNSQEKVQQYFKKWPNHVLNSHS